MALGAMPIPDNCARLGSYATDYPGERPDPDHPGQFLHGAVPPEEQFKKQFAEKSDASEERIQQKDSR